MIVNPTFVALALAIVAASVLALWWLLRGESTTTLLLLALLTSAALTVRLVDSTDFPRGLNEDEPKVLYAAGLAVRRGTLLAESNISVPILMHALFQGQLVPVLGAGRWAIRGYSLVGGVLCIPAAFAAARALQLAVAPSMAAAGLIAVLPWALFYSRVMQGAELTFQQLLLVAALARLVFAPGGPVGSRRRARAVEPAAVPADGAHAPRVADPVGWREWALGSFALAWLLYGYWCTRAMVGMPFVAALLARGRRRLWCLAVLLLPMLAYAPYLVANRHSMFVAQGVNPTYYAGFGGAGRLVQRLLDGLSAFVWPVGEDGWLTIRTAALHPPLLLLLAACGALSERRRAVFLFAGFLGGLAPAVLAWGPPSTHRMLMAFPFVALAVGCALDDLLVWRRVQAAVSAALVLAVGWYGIGLYFSDEFWPPESRGKFDWQRTALIESLPLPANVPVVLMKQTVSFGDARRLVAPNDEALSIENWFPSASGAVYAFSPEAAPLRPFYESLFGPRVESFGSAFKLTLEPADWSWLRQHGWSYEASCGNVVRRAQVPVLFQPNLTFASLVCEQAALHTWRARWDGPPTALRLHTYGHATVDAGSQHLESNADGEEVVDFTVEPGMDLRVSVATPPFNPWVYAALFERTPAGERVPLWERALPVP